MTKEEEQKLMEILNAKGTAQERKAKIADLSTTSEGCQRVYSENSKTDDSCSSGIAVQGVVTITNCPDPSDNGVYTGSWHCQ